MMKTVTVQALLASMALAVVGACNSLSTECVGDEPCASGADGGAGTGDGDGGGVGTSDAAEGTQDDAGPADDAGTPGDCTGPDTDSDGVPDACDNCPEDSNPEQDEVCGVNVDSDFDGVPDDSDNCPSKANPNQQDADSDGVGDHCDNCAVTANSSQADTNADGIGNACQNSVMVVDGVHREVISSMASGASRYFAFTEANGYVLHLDTEHRSGGSGDLDFAFAKEVIPTGATTEVSLTVGDTWAASYTNIDGMWIAEVKAASAINNVDLVVGRVPRIPDEGVVYTGLASASKQWKYFAFRAETSGRLTISTTSPNGDIDLYIRSTMTPTDELHDHASDSPFSEEELSINVEVDETVFVGMHAYEAYSGGSVTATFNAN